MSVYKRSCMLRYHNESILRTKYNVHVYKIWYPPAATTSVQHTLVKYVSESELNICMYVYINTWKSWILAAHTCLPNIVRTYFHGL